MAPSTYGATERGGSAASRAAQRAAQRRTLDTAVTPCYGWRRAACPQCAATLLRPSRAAQRAARGPQRRGAAGPRRVGLGAPAGAAGGQRGTRWGPAIPGPRLAAVTGCRASEVARLPGLPALGAGATAPGDPALEMPLRMRWAGGAAQRHPPSSMTGKMWPPKACGCTPWQALAAQRAAAPRHFAGGAYRASEVALCADWRRLRRRCGSLTEVRNGLFAF